MKTPVQYLLFAAFLFAAMLLIVYTSFYKPRQLSYQLNEQLDSLRHTLDQYNQALIQYDSAYQQLTHTRNRLVRLEDYYNQQLTVQQAELDDILNQLHELSYYNRYYRKYPHPVVVHPVDSLFFTP